MLGVLAGIFPVIVFLSLVVLKIPLRLFFLAVFISGVLILVFTAAGRTSGRKYRKKGLQYFFAVFLVVAGLVAVLSGSGILLKFYPVAVNAVFLVLFGHTLFVPPCIIYRFATLYDRSISHSMYRKRVEKYCWKVTVIWCIFFIINGSIAFLSVYDRSYKWWAVYNGCISYILMGILFAGEFLVRRIVQKSMKTEIIPLSEIKASSRNMDSIVTYEGKFSDGKYKTWSDFLNDCSRMRNMLEREQAEKWILHCEDCYFFYVTFAALLQCHKQVMLTANIAPAFLAEIWTQGVGFLTDQKIDDAVYIPDVLAHERSDSAELPRIDAEKTVIYMYTSGSTGRPKAVLQRLREFENDNAFILSMWKEEFYKRKVCSCVSQHHIYGLLFSCMLPFAAGIPFRRDRIMQPEGFEVLDDDSYMIIATPAFLKRTLENVSGRLHLKDPMIFTSGGVLTPEVAEQTDRIFGFWPVEVYGSTETSGIAYRQSKNGLEWTLFADAQIWKNSDGCLVIRSPYISDPAGFETADLVDIRDDGKFLLLGRSDSVVKIEEKRISVTEVENRLNQCEFVKDSCVIAMSDRRQYLAAAVVLNEKGLDKFKDTEKYLINRYFRDYLAGFFESVVIPRKWRYVDAVPQNAMGKRRKDEIKALFAENTNPALPGVIFRAVESSDSKVLLEVRVVSASPYFDGHFPEKQFLPAVAQFHIVAVFLRKYFYADVSLVETKRIKFCSPVFPDMPVMLQLKYDAADNKVNFSYKSIDGIKEYSRGTFFIRSEK
ncbi:MAG: AMP-binding protein [Spirochaetia bacterium]|nr:AMP-binding protein [Spirochaetia bacterium]